MQTKIRKLLPAFAMGIVAAVTFSACETPGETALLGAGTGAIVGSGTSGGALRGAAIGAGAGYVVGRVAQEQRRQAYEQGLADRGGYYYDDARYYRDGRYYNDSNRVVVRQRNYYVAPSYRSRVAYNY